MRIDERPRRERHMGWIFALAMIGIMVYALVQTVSEKDEDMAYGMHAEPIVTVYEETVEFKQEAKELEEMDYMWSDDRILIAKVVQHEAGEEPFVGQVAVASTILNRAELRGMTIEEVVYEKNQYASPWIGTIDTQVMDAVDFAIENRDLFPKNMFFFRTKHFHTLAFSEDYVQIGHHYFSTDSRYKEESK